MRTLIVIVVLVLLAPWLLRLWARHQNRVNFMNLPLFPSAYEVIDGASVPDSIRDGMAIVLAELAPLGFELAGYVGWPMFPETPPRLLAIARHPSEHAFATVAFSLSTLEGATVDFETLFEDGWWLRTVNRRGHFSLSTFPRGRVDDPLVATIAQQWQAHRTAVASESAHTPREADIAELARHRNSVELEEFTIGVAQGTHRRVDDGKSFRFTRIGARAFLERLQLAALRLATAQRPLGALAMPIPVDEAERKFQDILYIEAQRPKPRGPRAFLLSALAFAASALAFTHWAWLLWAIPFLLLHELGHWSAMRAFGHRDATIRFIPLLGAATLTTTRFRKLSHEMIVLLAGPVPGIALGLALFQMTEFGRHPYTIMAAIMLVTINSINLLPLHPLDGGRILHALITDGRPRLDIGLKVVAGAVFLAGAIAFKDVTLVLLAAAGLLFLRGGFRLAQIDSAIRRQPGFGPALTPVERRRFIFAALSKLPSTDGTTWVRTVQRLEVSLGHGYQRWWQAAPWAVVYAACLGGLIAWGVGVFSVLPSAMGGRCPPRTHAQTLACSAPAAGRDVDWSRREPGTLTRNPFKLASEAEHSFGGFVWCTGSGPAVRDAWQVLWETSAAASFCPALPWETIARETRAQHTRARATLFAVTGGGNWMNRDQLRENLARLRAGPHDPKAFDVELLDLYSAWLESGGADGPARRLSERLGRSPDESCRRIKIFSVSSAGAQNTDTDQDEDSDLEKGESPGAAPRILAFRLSVLVTAPADFAPLQRYLCEAGCQVDVLPYGSMDPRLRSCF